MVFIFPGKRHLEGWLQICSKSDGCFSQYLISSPWRRYEDYNISFCKQWKFRCHCSYEQWHLNLHCLQGVRVATKQGFQKYVWVTTVLRSTLDLLFNFKIDQDKIRILLQETFDSLICENPSQRAHVWDGRQILTDQIEFLICSFIFATQLIFHWLAGRPSLR